MKLVQTYKITPDGEIPIQELKNIREFHLKNKNRFVTSTFSTDKPKTTPQTRYWFGVVLKYITEFYNDLGNDTNIKQWYDYYVTKGIFGYKEFNGELVPKSLSEALIVDFQEAKEKIQRDWAARGLYIPDPLENIKEQNEN